MARPTTVPRTSAVQPDSAVPHQSPRPGNANNVAIKKTLGRYALRQTATNIIGTTAAIICICR